MKILLAVDGSSFTKKMLAYLTTHLEMFSGDVEFTALTVQGTLPPRARAAVGKEVIMGSRGHGALGGLVMGSVATRVLAHCQTPVLLVR